MDPAVLTLAEALEGAPRPTLVWGEGISALPTAAGGAGPLTFFTDDLITARALRCDSGVAPPGRGYERIALRVPKAKALLELRLRVAASLLAPGGELWVAGHGHDGIKGAARLLADVAGPTEVVRLKRRCRVLGARVAQPAEAVDPASLARRFEVPAAKGPLTVTSLPGVFNHGALDRGTALLLEQLDAAVPAWKRVLDLGCGAGVLGAWIARRKPTARVELLDVSATAVAASRQTLSDNGLEAVVHHALADELPENTYDLVVSNPPRHVGRDHDHDLTAALVEAAARRLKRGGRFFCVANHDKRLSAALEASFFQVEVRHHDPSYRVWEATR